MAFANEAEKQKSIDSGFTSTDAAVRAKVEAMSKAAGSGMVSVPTGAPRGIPGRPDTSFAFEPAPVVPTQTNRREVPVSPLTPPPVPVAPPPTPIPIASPSNAVTTTDQMRNQADTVKSGAGSVLADVNAFQDTVAGQAALADLRQKEAALNGPLTPEQEAVVKSQVDTARQNFERLIQDAQNQKEQAGPKNLIAAGQRGGLMNTQFSGIAALMPTKGGTFVGLGGELNRLNTEFDKQITDLKIRQLAAMEAASVAATDAIRTGAEEDLDRSMKMFALAQDLNAEHNDVAIKKEAALNDYIDKQKKEQQSIFNTVLSSGMTEADLPPGYFETMDVNLGLPLGSSLALFKHTQVDLETQKFNDRIKLDSQVAELQKSGALAMMDDAALADLAAKGGFNLDSLKAVRDTATKPGELQWDLTTDVDGNQIASRFDPKTGKYESVLLKKKTVKPVGGTGGGGGGAGIRTTPGGTDAPLSDQFEAVVINLGSVSAQQNARKYFQTLMDEGNTGKMESYLNRLALEGLKGRPLIDYNAMGTVSSGVQNALNDINSFAKSDPGVYKSALESAKPFLNASKDQAWVKFSANVQATQAGYRNALFGAALTPQENALANQFLVDFSQDSVETIKTKLENLKQLSGSVQSRLLGEQRGVFSADSEPEKPSLDSFVNPLEQFVR